MTILDAPKGFFYTNGDITSESVSLGDDQHVEDWYLIKNPEATEADLLAALEEVGILDTD